LRNGLVIAGIIIVASGLILNSQTALLARSIMSETQTFDVPDNSLMAQVIRVSKGDVVQVYVDVQGEGGVYLMVDMVYFYVGPRTETGGIKQTYTTTVYDPGLVTSHEEARLTADLSGHFNVLLNNTAYPGSKVVTVMHLFERSRNIEYVALVLRNISVLIGGAFLVVGLLELREERTSIESASELHQGLQ
jgi:hypothetical protein